MDKRQQKLTLFAGIFIICAVIIFLFMNNQQRPSMMPEKGFSDLFHDSLALIEEIGQLKSQLRDNPDNHDILTKIGNHYFDINQPKNAIEYYERALQIKPDNPSVLTDCAVMYNQLDQNDKALEYLDKAIVFKPDLAQAYINKGVILMTAKNDPRKAVAVWKKFIEIAPESEHANFLRQQIKAIESGQ
jgi:tetratricopeptide (TPR) repeat protein